jgi:hypothetical protein
MQLADLVTILQVTDLMVSLVNLVERTCVKKIEKKCTCKIGYWCNLENEILGGA